MLEVDLGRLEREGRATVAAEVAAGHPMWNGVEVRLHGPLRVRLEAQSVGPDVLVRGRMAVEVEQACRRCLTDVVVGVEESVTMLFRAGIDEIEAEEQEVYRLPERARDLDLAAAVREQLLLAVPQYVVCGEACRGICPRCGANLNEAECACAGAESDDRWAPLRELKRD